MDQLVASEIGSSTGKSEDLKEVIENNMVRLEHYVEDMKEAHKKELVSELVPDNGPKCTPSPGSSSSLLALASSLSSLWPLSSPDSSSSSKSLSALNSVPATTETKRKQEDPQANSTMKATIKKVKKMNESEKMESLLPHGKHESEAAKTMEARKKPDLNQSRSWFVDSNELPPNLPLFCSDNESKAKSTQTPTKFGKKTKHESKVGNKELPKSMPNCKKERNVKCAKSYKKKIMMRTLTTMKYR
jgi:hypothetical protein